MKRFLLGINNIYGLLTKEVRLVKSRKKSGDILSLLVALEATFQLITLKNDTSICTLFSISANPPPRANKSSTLL